MDSFLHTWFFVFPLTCNWTLPMWNCSIFSILWDLSYKIVVKTRLEMALLCLFHANAIALFLVRHLYSLSRNLVIMHICLLLALLIKCVWYLVMTAPLQLKGCQVAYFKRLSPQTQFLWWTNTISPSWLFFQLQTFLVKQFVAYMVIVPWVAFFSRQEYILLYSISGVVCLCSQVETIDIFRIFLQGLR